MAWRTISHGELASLLSQAELLHSEVMAASTIYHFVMQQQEMIAVAVQADLAFLVEASSPQQLRRRHTEVD